MRGYAKRHERQHNHDAWMMWHNAVLGRSEKVPDMQKFMYGKKPVKGIDEAAILASFKAYSERLANGKSVS